MLAGLILPGLGQLHSQLEFYFEERLLGRNL